MSRALLLLLAPFIPMIVRHGGDWLNEILEERKRNRRRKQLERQRAEELHHD